MIPIDCPQPAIVLPRYFALYSNTVCGISKAPKQCIVNMRVPPPLRQEEIVTSVLKFPEAMQPIVMKMYSLERYDDIAFIVESIDVLSKVAELYEETIHE